jgi:CRISPR-associated protein Cas6
MFWEEDTEQEVVEESPRVVDLAFTIRSRMLPVDHLYALKRALLRYLPELEEWDIGVHEIHLAGSQNGWERPDPALGQHLVPSRRTRMHLRVPGERAQTVKERLQGVTLDLDGFELTLDKAREKRLFSHPTLYARHMRMQGSEAEDENRFLERIAGELAERNIRVKKALCGKTTEIATPEGPWITRSLMLADLSPADSLRLQEEGLGGDRQMGCGLFLPMKGIQTLSGD